MNAIIRQSIGLQLSNRRLALQSALNEVGQAEDLLRLLGEVDQALERLGTSDYGVCRVCLERMEDEEMLAEPMRQYCLCDLTQTEQRALERDLDLAWKVQSSLLPPQDLVRGGWQTHYRYLPAGPVSGDYCDVIPAAPPGEGLDFLVGDVAGKGIAASYLMAHLSALVRRSLDQAISVSELVAAADRHLSERSAESRFVTLVAGRARTDGHVDLVNAGHCRPIVLRRDGATVVDDCGLPLGIDADDRPPTRSLQLDPGDSIVLFTDGVSEARDVRDEMYGATLLQQTAFAHRHEPPAQLAAACLADLRRFRGVLPQQDDLTLLVLRRLASEN